MLQMKRSLIDAVIAYEEGSINYAEFKQRVVLAIAETGPSVEVAGWLRDAIRNQVDEDETQEIR